MSENVWRLLHGIRYLGTAIRRRKAEAEFREEKERERQAVHDEMARMGFLNELLGDPTRESGAAVELMRRYGVELHKGMSYGDVRAVLEKERWDNPINPEVCSFQYGTFSHKNPADVIHIYGYHIEIPMAICRCLVHARIAGVIEIRGRGATPKREELFQCKRHYSNE